MRVTTASQSSSTFTCSARPPTLARSSVSNSSPAPASPINVSATSVSCSSSTRTKRSSPSSQTRSKSLSFFSRLLRALTVRSDLNHANMYVVGLGLCTFANIASEEMSRDLANEIEKLLGSSNTYIRKKVPSTFRPLSLLIPPFRLRSVPCESSKRSPSSPITSSQRRRTSSQIATTVYSLLPSPSFPKCASWTTTA